MRVPKDMWMWLGIAIAGFAAINWAQSQGWLPAPATATPLSVYPSIAALTKTSMAATPAQQTTAPLIPVSAFSSVQQENVAAIAQQCAGATVCSPLVGDTQLGF